MFSTPEGKVGIFERIILILSRSYVMVLIGIVLINVRVDQLTEGPFRDHIGCMLLT